MLTMLLNRKLARALLPLPLWRFQIFAVMFTNFFRGVYKLWPWCSQTFAVMFTNFCRGVHKLLPWCLKTFTVAFTIFCRGFRYMKVHIFALRWRDEIKRSSQLRTLLKRVVINRTWKKFRPVRCSQTFAVVFTNFCHDACGPPYGSDISFLNV